LRGGSSSITLNCGYGRGYSVLETIEAVRRVSMRNFAVSYAPRRPGDIMTMVADTSRITRRWTGRRNSTIWRPSPPMRWPGNRSCSATAAAFRSMRNRPEIKRLFGLKKPRQAGKDYPQQP
jgi:hypothetical protein